jgi:hypothetical protein
MKFILTICTLALFVFMPRQAAAQDKAKWAEMLAFHEVMSTTFHPAEKGDFKPLREKAGLLLERAEAWRKSPVPAGYKAEITAATLKELVKKCKAIKKAVRKEKTDKELMGMISSAHDTFHEVMEKCRD